MRTLARLAGLTRLARRSRFAAPAVAAAVAAALAAAPSRAQVEPEMAARIRREGLDHSRVMEWQDYLCNHIGPRITGSDAFALACRWAQGELAELGLEARLEQWGEWKLIWNRGPWSARVLQPQPLELEVATPAWSPPTLGRVRARLVAMPNTEAELAALEADLARGPLLLYGPRPSRALALGRRVRELLAAEAFAGYLQSADSTGLTDPTYANQLRVFGDYTVALREFDRRPRMPHVVVRDDHAAQLEAMLAGGEPVVVELEVRNQFRRGPIALHNVIADLPGREKPDETVVVSAHLDSWHLATGATDNGTGVSTTLEAARILTAVGAQPRRTIRFCLWGGEEQGLLGSHQYVIQHRSAMRSVSVVLNHDAGTNWACGLTVPAALVEDLERALAPLAQLAPPQPGHAGPVFALRAAAEPRLLGGGSDHASFAAAGVPAFPWDLCGEHPYAYGWHSQWDTYDLVVERYQRHTATVVALAALGIANLPDLLPREGARRRQEAAGAGN